MPADSANTRGGLLDRLAQIKNQQVWTLFESLDGTRKPAINKRGGLTFNLQSVDIALVLLVSFFDLQAQISNIGHC